MQDIVIKVPDDFTAEQIEFIKQSAINQIESEIKKTLVVPQEQIDAAQEKIDSVKNAMNEEKA